MVPLPHHIRDTVLHSHWVGVVVRRVGDRKCAAGRYIAAAAVVVEVEGGSSAQVGLRLAEEGRTALSAGEERNAAVLVLVAGLEVGMRPSREEEGSSFPAVEGFLARNLTCWSLVLEKSFAYLFYLSKESRWQNIERHRFVRVG